MNTCLDLRGKYGKMSEEKDRESRQPHVMLEASTGGLNHYANKEHVI